MPGDSPWLSQPGTPCPLPGYTPRSSHCLASGIKGPWGSLQPWGAAWDHPTAPKPAGGRVCPVPGGCGGRCLVAPAIINPRGPGSSGCHSLTGSGLKSYQSCGVPYNTAGLRNGAAGAAPSRGQGGTAGGCTATGRAVGAGPEGLCGVVGAQGGDATRSIPWPPQAQPGSPAGQEGRQEKCFQAMLFISPGFTPRTGPSSTTETHEGSVPALGAGWGAVLPSRRLPWATPLPLAGQWGPSGGPGRSRVWPRGHAGHPAAPRAG